MLAVASVYQSLNASNSEVIWNKEGFLEPNLIFREQVKDHPVDRVCPFSLTNGKELDEEHLATEFLKTSVVSDEKIGLYNNLYVGYSLKQRNTSSSGGIATYIFEQLLKKKLLIIYSLLLNVMDDMNINHSVMLIR